MEKENKLGLFSLIALVIGSMIGGGAFSLPADMSKGASAGAIIIGWIITGVGMIALALVYQNLANRKPDLNGGVYSYAKAGFGEYMGFNSAWGYWLSALIGNVSYLVMLFGAIGYFIPAFGKGNNILSIVCASILVWSVQGLISKGIQGAALINIVTTIGKLVPIFLFLIVIIISFKVNIFALDFWGKTNPSLGSVMQQVKSTMLVTTWVFIGIEGAVVLSGRAKNRSDVGKATVMGLVGTLVIYVLISVLSLGVMNQASLSKLDTPSMAYVLEAIVGKWGAAIINLGLVISLLGAILGWSLLAAEIPFVAAKDGVFPKIFSKQNKNAAPMNSLTLTNIVVQVALILTLFSNGTYQMLYSIASAAILIPYLFSGLYGWKLSASGETYNENSNGRTRDIIIAVVSSIYATWLVYAAGTQSIMIIIVYAVGIPFFIKAKKEEGKDPFLSYEKILAAVIFVAGIIALYMVITGKLG